MRHIYTHLYIVGFCYSFDTIGSDQIVKIEKRMKKIPKSVRVQVNIIIDYYIAFLLPLACYFQAEKYKNNDMHVKTVSHNFLQFVSCSMFL